MFLSVARACAVALTCIWATAPASAQVTLQDYKDRVNDENWVLVFAGAMEAYGWANASLEQEGHPLLFCWPRNEPMNAQAGMAVVNAYAIGAPDEFDSYPLGFIILRATQARFPC